MMENFKLNLIKMCSEIISVHPLVSLYSSSHSESVAKGVNFLAF